MTNKMFSTGLQDHIINTARKHKIPVTIFLRNGQIYRGTIASFDQFTVKLNASTNSRKPVEKVESLIYKSCILTIVPAKKISLKK